MHKARGRPRMDPKLLLSLGILSFCIVICPNQTLQGPQIDPPLYLRVGGIEYLEAAVEQEACLPVGAHPTADGVACFKEPYRSTGRDEIRRAGQAC